MTYFYTEEDKRENRLTSRFYRVPGGIFSKVFRLWVTNANLSKYRLFKIRHQAYQSIFRTTTVSIGSGALRAKEPPES